MSQELITFASTTMVDVLAAVVAAATYSALFYLKKRSNNAPTSEEFDQTKFIATVVVGALVGLSMSLSGVSVDADNIEQALVMYTGMIVLVEGFVKTAFRQLNADKS